MLSHFRIIVIVLLSLFWARGRPHSNLSIAFYCDLPPAGLQCLLNGFNLFRLRLSKRLPSCVSLKKTLFSMLLISPKRDPRSLPPYHFHTLRYRLPFRMQISLFRTRLFSHIWQCKVKIAFAVNRLVISKYRYSSSPICDICRQGSENNPDEMQIIQSVLAIVWR